LILFNFSDTTFFIPPHTAVAFSFTLFQTFEIVFFIPLNTFLIPFHNASAFSLTTSQFLYNATPIAINAPIATTTTPIGLAVIAAFNAHCAAVATPYPADNAQCAAVYAAITAPLETVIAFFNPITITSAFSTAVHVITIALYNVTAPTIPAITGENVFNTEITPAAEFIANESALHNVGIVTFASV